MLRQSVEKRSRAVSNSSVAQLQPGIERLSQHDVLQQPNANVHLHRFLASARDCLLDLYQRSYEHT